MNIPVLLPGDEIEYRKRVGRIKKYIEQHGIIIQDAGKYWAVNLGKYRETIMKNDLVTGEIEILSVKEGAEKMYIKLEMPPKEVLQELFDKAGGNIMRASKLSVPPVSDVTMGRWLREVGIIPESGLRKQPDAPPVDVLRADWDACNHKLSVLAKRHNVTGAIAKRWLKAAGIVTEGPTGLITNQITFDSQPPNENNTVSQDNSNDDGYDPNRFCFDDDKPIPYIVSENADNSKELSDIGNIEEAWRQLAIVTLNLRSVTERLISLEKTVAKNICNPDDAADQERIKKLVDFCIAPLSGRIEKMESSVASVVRLYNAAEFTASSSSARLNVLADLMILVLERI